jgi:hypothetical protein
LPALGKAAGLHAAVERDTLSASSGAAIGAGQRATRGA